MNEQPIDHRLVVDTTPALVFSARPDGYVDYFNQRWLDCLSVPLAALEGEGWTRFIHPDDLAEHLRRWRTAMAIGESPVSQARVRMANGEYRWMLHRAEPLRDAVGNIVRWFGSSVDIEELKRAEHELRELKEQLHRENIALRDEVSQTSMSDDIIGSSPAQARADRRAKLQARITQLHARIEVEQNKVEERWKAFQARQAAKRDVFKQNAVATGRAMRELAKTPPL
jgi:PAS domain S-box-containing protein